MTEETNGSLKNLQDMDLQIEKMRARVAEFDPLLEEVEQPALALEQEVTTLKSRLQEMKVEERRLEHSADDRRARWRKLEERLKSVRNLREEAAVRAEMDLLRMALEGDEQEALTLLDQIKRMEERLQDGEAALEEARSEVEPRRRQLLEEKESAIQDCVLLKERREAYAALVPSRERENYERIRGGGRAVAVASLTPDGACGHCFGMIPLQVQNEVRKGAAGLSCEFCGVLLSVGDETA
jgi:predicted  nucleic acid-binding Zn-ribbon protein